MQATFFSMLHTCLISFVCVIDMFVMCAFVFVWVSVGVRDSVGVCVFMSVCGCVCTGSL